MSVVNNGQGVQRALELLRRGRPYRLVAYLAARPGGTLTGEIAQACACSNVSDAAISAREVLEPLGMTIIGEMPNPPTRNRFGEVSLQYRWRLARLP